MGSLKTFQSGIYQKNTQVTLQRWILWTRFLHEKHTPPATCEWEFQLLKSWCSNQPLQKPIHERIGAIHLDLWYN